jgi:pyruvate,orthophosphate dikinase
MVFGNLDERSGTGVLFSRNPLTGERTPFGEWLTRAQGEEVVSGRRTPGSLDQLRSALPNAHRELLEIAARLEADARDIQDIEFTVESGRLWLLQTRPAKRAPRAAVHLAVALCEEGMIRTEEALSRVAPDQVRNLLRPQLDPSVLAQARLLASGEPACPGFALGTVVTDSITAMERSQQEDVILARRTTSPDDIQGMIAARGIVTAVGGATSHAAVVSRELGVPCVVGCGEAALRALEGRSVTVDGASGKVYEGRIEVLATSEEHDRDMAQLIRWAQAQAPLQVYVCGEALPAVPVELMGPPEQWFSAAPASGAAGAALDTDAGVAGAIRAGFTFLVVPHRLPALLAAIRAVA